MIDGASRLASRLRDALIEHGVRASLGVATTAWLAHPFVTSGELSGPLMALLVLLPLALADLTVPLDVSVGTGRSWHEAAH